MGPDAGGAEGDQGIENECDMSRIDELIRHLELKEHPEGGYFKENYQYVVQAGDWFASEVSEADSYSLAGCTVSPGFDFDDFEMASREELAARYSFASELIRRLTRF